VAKGHRVALRMLLLRIKAMVADEDSLRKLIFHINSRHYVANMWMLDEACAELGLPVPPPPPPREVAGG
jgi:hypothetical protein